MSGACGGQKRVLDLLELEFICELPCGCLELKHPLEEKLVPFLQPVCFKDVKKASTFVFSQVN